MLCLAYGRSRSFFAPLTKGGVLFILREEKFISLRLLWQMRDLKGTHSLAEQGNRVRTPNTKRFRAVCTERILFLRKQVTGARVPGRRRVCVGAYASERMSQKTYKTGEAPLFAVHSWAIKAVVSLMPPLLVYCKRTDGSASVLFLSKAGFPRFPPRAMT